MPNAAIDAEVLARWNAGEDAVEIAKALGLGSSTIYRSLNRQGIVPSKAKGRPKNDWRRKHTAEQEREIVRRYLDGEPVRAIARDFDCDQATVRNVIVRAGERVRAVGGPQEPWNPAEAQEAIRLRESGMAVWLIAERLGVGVPRLQRLLRAQGVGPRKQLPNGGRTVTPQGYVYVLVRPEDPFAAMRNSLGYVAEHRLVMAHAIGRVLARDETVHHKNGDKGDNRLTNLQLRGGRHGKGHTHRCEDCGSANVRHIHL